MGGYKGENMKLLQRQMMLNHLLEHKEITGLEALQKYGILCYTKRISELRNQGYQIKTEWVTKRSKFGNKRFAKYILIKLPKKSKKKAL